MEKFSTRVKNAIRVLRGGSPDIMRNFWFGGPDAKDVTFSWPSWRTGKPQWHTTDFRTYVNEGFNMNAWVYSAIMFKVRSITQAPLRAYSGNPGNPVELPERDSLAKLISRPNEHQSFIEFQGQNIVYLNIAGNSYIYLDREARNMLPSAMYSLRPDQVYVIPDKAGRGLLGYVYVPEGKCPEDGIPILPHNLIHTKLPNPMDPLGGMGEGLSPISAAARTIDVDNAITHFLKLFFDKGVSVPGILSTQEKLSPRDVSRIRERWKEIYGGYRRWSEEIGVLESGTKYERVGLTFEEMGFGEMDERSETRILGPFGVPPILVGSRIGLLRSTYSNYQQARQACWQDTLVPELRLFETDYRHYLSDRDRWVGFDLSKVPALQEAVSMLVNAAFKMWRMGTPAEVAFATVGLNVPPFEGSNTGFVPRNTVPIGLAEENVSEEEIPESTEEEIEEGEEEEESELEEEESEEDGSEEEFPKALKSSYTDEQKEIYWKNFDATATSYEGRIQELSVEMFGEDRDYITGFLEGKEDDDVPDWFFLYPMISDYSGGTSYNHWVEGFVPLANDILLEWGNSLAEEYEQTINPDWVQSLWVPGYAASFAKKVTGTTELELAKLIQAGMQEGWTAEEALANMNALFDLWMEGKKDSALSWLGVLIFRASIIASTEVARLMNWGAWHLFGNWQIPYKEWVTTMDGRQRFDHGEANGQVRPLNQPFNIGGHLMQYPGDPAGPPEQVINCRCTILGVNHTL